MRTKKMTPKQKLEWLIECQRQDTIERNRFIPYEGELPILKKCGHSLKYRCSCNIASEQEVKFDTVSEMSLHRSNYGKNAIS